MTKLSEELTDALVVFLRDRLRDHGANIASLSDVLVESELDHELVQDPRADDHCHVLFGRNFGKTIARNGGNNEVIRQGCRIRGILLLNLVQDRQELQEGT